MSDYGDPEPGDENDPEFQNEVFETMRESGTTPEDLPDPEDAASYAKWLKDRLSEPQ